MCKIYKLIDPITKDVKYIGKTKRELYERLAEHIQEFVYRKRIFSYKKQDWIKNLLKENKIPEIHLIEEVDESISSAREEYWISYYSNIGELFNTIYNNDEVYSKSISDRKSIVVYQYDLYGNFIQSWQSMTLAADTLKVDSGNISYACTGKRKQCAGYQWRYFKIEKINPYRKNLTTKIVYKYDLSGNYICSYVSARAAVGFSYKGISKCCTGKAKTYKGFYFSFIKSDKINLPKKFVRKSKI